jgi:tetratricopeptide (TPR) repeat protein
VSKSVRTLLALLALAAAAAGVWRYRHLPKPGRPVAEVSAAEVYVGSAACAQCHAAQTKLWRESQHAAAMAVATDKTVLGRFNQATFTYAGTTSTFLRKDAAFQVRTDGPDGRLGTFDVAYTFGVFPLQQYLVPTSGGRLQALGMAWDSRAKADGGQRWFHLYPRDAIRADDPLHWTKPNQNWNFMCADCHATNLRKGYDADEHTFETAWTELGVGCEACHGPGSRHVALMRSVPAVRAPAGLGLVARLDERKGVRWLIDGSAGHPSRSLPRTTDREIEVCARCHARRSQLTDNARPGQPLEDAFRVSLLEPQLFYPDGQPRDEVYNYAAFTQSRMYAKGVTCSDCHEPHAGKLRISGNGTCTRCHQADRYETEAHTMHQPGSAAAACATCHMPVSTYMVVDQRHDHSFRVPRPDRTVTLGVPNVCTSACHAGRNASWAAEAVARHTGHAPAGFQSFAEAFAAADRHAPGATAPLLAIAADSTQAAIARASALARLQERDDLDVSAVMPLLGDASALVRRTSAGLLARADDSHRVSSLPKMLADPVRTVREEVALALADLADRALSGADQAAFERAFGEFVAEQRFNGDRPEAQVNLGQAWLRRGRLDAAQKAFQEAIRLDASFVPARVDLSEVYRLRHDEATAEQVLRDGLTASSPSAVLHHALGLSLVRQHRVTDALPELATAAKLDPAVARYAYVYAVALHDSGRVADAIRQLRAAASRWPEDRDIRQALDSYLAGAGG